MEFSTVILRQRALSPPDQGFVSYTSGGPCYHDDTAAIAFTSPSRLEDQAEAQTVAWRVWAR